MIGGLMKTTSRFAIAAAASVLATQAFAADLGGNCCADLEERVAELEATTARKGNRKVSLEVSGHVSQQIMYWNDGKESNVYVGNNTVTASRFRFVGSAKIDATWSAGYLMEFGVYSGAASFTMAQGRAIADDTPGTGYPAPVSFLQLRHSAWWLDHKDLGRLWVGQTSQATDGIAIINLANTTVAGAHAKTNLNDSGMFLRTKANVFGNTTATALPVGLSAITWGNIRNHGHGDPGDGDRLQVVKYVSPTIQGFIFSAAWGEDDMWDVSLKYANEWNGVRVAAGIGYSQLTDGNFDGGNGLPFCAGANTAAAPAGLTRNGSDVKCDSLAGSASIMHVPTGLFLTGAAGRVADGQRSQRAVIDGTAPVTKGTDSFWYLQAGIEKNWFGIGKTTLYGEYHSASSGSAVVAGAGLRPVGATDTINSFGAAAFINSSQINTWGLGVVQAVDAAAMDLYISYRVREADVTLARVDNGALAKSRPLEDLQILSVGGMIKF